MEWAFLILLMMIALNVMFIGAGVRRVSYSSLSV